MKHRNVEEDKFKKYFEATFQEINFYFFIFAFYYRYYLSKFYFYK